ncbi:uncharacterized protein [Henckelia pumila]|uniref:uncharacterized protein n=1 Tax=Henckelia pumila TaxID=405737 RepID=UPI003C6E4706
MSKVFSDLERSVCRMVHRQIGAIQAVSRKAYFIAVESEIQPNRFVLKEQVNFCKVTRSCRTSRLGRKNKKAKWRTCKALISPDITSKFLVNNCKNSCFSYEMWGRMDSDGVNS